MARAASGLVKTCLLAFNDVSGIELYNNYNFGLFCDLACSVSKKLLCYGGWNVHTFFQC